MAQLQSQLNTTAHKTINNKTLTNMIHNGIEYYTFDELFPIAQAALRNKILNSEYKFLGDINKTFNNKTDTGKWLKQNGYIKQRILVNGKRSNYYYKAEIKSQMQTSENSEINPL